MTHNHLQHEGELAVQRQRGVAPHLTEDLPHYISDQMPMQHALFFTHLLYFAVAKLDVQGRPWATLLVGTHQQPSPVQAVDLETLEVHTQLPSWDPFRRSLGLSNSTTDVWAGLGVDFSNRRRNKVAGVVQAASVDGDDLRMTLETNENLGNCPKYITVRQLIPSQRTPQLAIDAFNTPETALSSDAVALVHRASTVFLATRHVTSQPSTTDMGLNHRGGSPGFIRVERDERGEPTILVIPDYSGNRFYQSLGNVQTDRLAGLVIPCFDTGDILHVTGTADNVFDAAAEAIMPRVTLLTRIRITGFVYIKNRIGLQMIGPESLSPYNPPVRLLQSELGFQATKDLAGETTATLVDIQCLSPSISSFTFELSRAVTYTPGSFVVLDFSTSLERTYRHMNERNPQQVNDDFVRTWTISSAPPFDPLTRSFMETTRITCTIKHVKNGAVTPFLHRQRLDKRGGGGGRLRVPVRGIGGDFSVFSTTNAQAQGAITVDSPRMLWIAAGVGITPFMAFASGLDHAEDSSTDVELMVADRGEEASVAPRVFGKYKFVSRVTVFDSKPTADHPPSTERGAYHARRMQRGDLAAIRDLASRTVYLCGPPSFMADVTKMLQQEGVAPHQIKQESFAF